jgi:hypothetical protein
MTYPTKIRYFSNSTESFLIPNAKTLYITCDCGGAMTTELKCGKLQQFVNRTRLEVQVSHFPPGTSKWNKVEHRLCCYISKIWQGKPLVDIQTAVNLIGTTQTTTGLRAD